MENVPDPWLYIFHNPIYSFDENLVCLSDLQLCVSTNSISAQGSKMGISGNFADYRFIH